MKAARKPLTDLATSQCASVEPLIQPGREPIIPKLGFLEGLARQKSKYHAKSPMKSRIISICSYLFSSIAKVLCTLPPGLAIANPAGFRSVNAAFARVGLSSVTPLKTLLAGH
jgi:hypothetical protein